MADTLSKSSLRDDNYVLHEVKKRSLGTVRLRDERTKEIVLAPRPSSDPNDPLNWSSLYKYYTAGLICFITMVCTFLAAGPSVAITTTAKDFFPDLPLKDSLTKVAYFFTTTSLLQGVGNVFWVPMAIKYGRRPIYIASFSIYLATSIWLIFEKDYYRFLTGRILLGFGSGAAETIAPVSIADMFFLHERGVLMAAYSCSMTLGVALGFLLDGFIVMDYGWRVCYQVASGIIGFCLLLILFTFSETAYHRNSEVIDVETTGSQSPSDPIEPVGIIDSPKKSYLKSLKVYEQVWTDESFLRLFLRPLGLICLPLVLWAAFVEAVTIGFLVAVSSNIGSAFELTYGFKSWQIGLCYISAIIGSLLGILSGGHLVDMTADLLTKRNKGIRIPEMRLPAMGACLVTTPLALVLYGVGVEKKLHWICPTVGLGLLNFSVASGGSIALVYVIDSYRPVAGEVTLAVMCFKALFGFLLSFYTNPWVQSSGYLEAFGAMAGIAAVVLIMFVPFFYWGETIRHMSWSWPVLSYVAWNNDREVGE